MFALTHGEALGASEEVGPTVAELLMMAADIVAMVEGRADWVCLGGGRVSVHVGRQADAEYLAWRLGLGDVADYEPIGPSPALAVWSGGERPEPGFKIFCTGELVRPVRAFPRRSLRIVNGECGTV